MRIIPCGLLLAALLATPVVSSAQTPASTETRPGLPTNFGDTGFWFVPTAETLPSGRSSFSVYRANFDRRPGITDVSELGITGAHGFGERFEMFASWRLVRIDRDLRPIFIPGNPFGGVAHEYPYVRRGWSDSLGGPIVVGGKWNLISQSRGDAMSLAVRPAVKFPTGSSWASTNDLEGHIDLVASREFNQSFELSGVAGGVLRGDPKEFSVSDGVKWGLGASFPSRRALRALVEWHGEFVIDESTIAWDPAGPYVAEDGSIAPTSSRIYDPTEFKIGAVWQSSRGMFLHSGFNYSHGIQDRVINGTEYKQNGWGWDIRLGWHPGTKVYVPPPPPEPVIREVIREVPGPAAAAPPPPNRNPTFSVNANCNPSIVEPSQNSNCTATATDPDGDAVTYRWTAPQGTFNAPNAGNSAWTAPNQTGNVPLTVTAQDARGGTATSTMTVQVARREALMFEDVHFDFDRFNLKPEALAILDDAIGKLQANPGLNVTIEGHADSMGTIEYNIALGERRANSVRDYLASRGVAANRLRTVSYGEERPIADNNTAAGRALNRRAHLAVIIQ